MDKNYSITFFYYPDLSAVTPFYENILGFKLVLDQKMARIYRVGEASYFGIVDGNKGHLRHQEKSAVLFTIVTPDVEAWHEKLKRAGVANLTEIKTGTFCDHFFFEDPAGYALEIQRFRNPAVAALFQ